ncbi:MAG TPA: hypothetical protein DDW51_29010 [Cyanobacteria bacterium UBA11367]|nr:hypothetical protein [Cyanobacteria bacterium UBA11367]HBS72551.1 hypothetical protein [Cyanobacteria bacterium UBA11153]
MAMSGIFFLGKILPDWQQKFPVCYIWRYNSVSPLATSIILMPWDEISPAHPLVPLKLINTNYSEL